MRLSAKLNPREIMDETFHKDESLQNLIPIKYSTGDSMVDIEPVLSGYLNNGANIINRIGAISVISKLIFKKSTNNNIVQKALILLGNAALHNNDNKNLLCNEQVMELVNSRILSDVHNTKMIASGSYFLSCLCSGNDKVQNKFRKIKLLDRLVALYRTYHPKGDSHSTPSKEHWFEKASSNSPIILTHISHVLKSLMSKPKNVENQIICSRLLNLALYNLGTNSDPSACKIEALQFIADCLYENEKTQRIFNMVGGMRILTQLLKKESRTNGDFNDKGKLELVNSVLDTIIVAITDHNQNKEGGIECCLIEDLVNCLQNERANSFHMKSMMCLSELVHENEACQKRLVSCNAVPEIINIMSKRQDEMLSKIGTSILQNCIQYQDDLDGHVNVEKRKTEQETPLKHAKPSLLQGFMETLGDTAVPDFLSSLVKKLPGSENHKPVKAKTIRRVKRSLLSASSTPSLNKDVKNHDEMMGMLKSQNKLLQKFQDEIKNLRAEVRSQAASDCGDLIQHNGSIVSVPMTPSRMAVQRRFATPTRRLYENMCPGTLPRKTKPIVADESLYCTPHHKGRIIRQHTERCLNDEQPLRGDRTVFECDTPLCIQMPGVVEGSDNIQDDDERPALCEDIEIQTPTIPQQQQSVFEKVHKWQKESVNCFLSPNDFNIKLPLPNNNKDNLAVRNSSRQSKLYKTPDTHFKPSKNVLCAPKKKEPTKRRCPISSDEGFCDDLQMGDSSHDSYPGIRRTLSFDKVRDELEPIQEHGPMLDESPRINEQKNQATIQARYVKMNKTNTTCKGCSASLLQVNSRNLIKVIANSDHTCDFHQIFVKKLGGILTKKTQGPFSAKSIFKSPLKKTLPRKSLLSKSKTDWDSMSVFSYKSDRSYRSHISVRSGYTTMTSSNRRQRMDYSREEVQFILDGVERYGRRWKIILEAYPFQSGRTAIDLKDKYKKLKVQAPIRSTIPVPFTTQELVNLRHGVSKYGAKGWSNILKNYQFEASRTPDELREKWEKLMKRTCVS